MNQANNKKAVRVHSSRKPEARSSHGHTAGESGPPPAYITEKQKYLFFIALSAMFVIMAFVIDTPIRIANGSMRILVSTANLVTDYIALAGAGAAFLNVGIMTLLSLGIVKAAREEINGLVIAALFTVAGFSLFGKNLYNSLPITAGVFLYTIAIRAPFGKFLSHALFGTALAPLVSEITFGLGLSLPVGTALGVSAGILAGFLIPPLATHFFRFHQGFSLYNIGFTAGIIGMFFLAILRRFGMDVAEEMLVSSGNNTKFAILLFTLFLSMLLLGALIDHGALKGLHALFAKTGQSPSDFATIVGIGPTLVNMALLGCMTTAYVLLTGGELSGPAIGGILTVAGFGAFGKHVRNTAPVIFGVFLANLFYIHDISSTAAVLGALFGTTLAPITGRYGVFSGIAAGALHMAVVSNLSYLHGGMNLYNNGFAGGFIAAALVPLLDTIKTIRNKQNG